MKTLTKLMIVTIIAGFSLVSTAGMLWSGEKKYELSFASEYPPKHPTIVNGYIPLFEELKEKTQGRLDIQYYAPNVLAPDKEYYSAVANGVVDMAFVGQGFTAGQMPLAKIGGLPLMFDNSEIGGMVTWELYKRFPEWAAEYKDIKALWHHVSAPFEIHTVKKEIRTLEDAQGLKMIVWLPVVRDIVKALGMNPVEVGVHDTYLALQRGMADGVVCPIAPMRSMKITEVTKHHTLFALAVDTFWGGINKDRFNELPADLQKILLDNMGDHIARISGKTLDDGAARDTEWMKNNGHTVYTLPLEEKKRWLEKVKFMHEDLLKELEGAGYKNAREIYNTALKLNAEYSK